MPQENYKIALICAASTQDETKPCIGELIQAGVKPENITELQVPNSKEIFKQLKLAAASKKYHALIVLGGNEANYSQEQLTQDCQNVRYQFNFLPLVVGSQGANAASEVLQQIEKTQNDLNSLRSEKQHPLNAFVHEILYLRAKYCANPEVTKLDEILYQRLESANKMKVSPAQLAALKAANSLWLENIANSDKIQKESEERVVAIKALVPSLLTETEAVHLIKILENDDQGADYHTSMTTESSLIKYPAFIEKQPAFLTYNFIENMRLSAFSKKCRYAAHPKLLSLSILLFCHTQSRVKSVYGHIYVSVKNTSYSLESELPANIIEAIENDDYFIDCSKTHEEGIRYITTSLLRGHCPSGVSFAFGQNQEFKEESAVQLIAALKSSQSPDVTGISLPETLKPELVAEMLSLVFPKEEYSLIKYLRKEFANDAFISAKVEKYYQLKRDQLRNVNFKETKDSEELAKLQTELQLLGRVHKETHEICNMQVFGLEFYVVNHPKALSKAKAKAKALPKEQCAKAISDMNYRFPASISLGESILSLDEQFTCARDALRRDLDGLAPKDVRKSGGEVDQLIKKMEELFQSSPRPQDAYLIIQALWQTKYLIKNPFDAEIQVSYLKLSQELSVRNSPAKIIAGAMLAVLAATLVAFCCATVAGTGLGIPLISWGLNYLIPTAVINTVISVVGIGLFSKGLEKQPRKQMENVAIAVASYQPARQELG